MQEFFEHLVEYQLEVCKRCGHAVWPEQIESHLTGKQHRIQRKKAVSTAERLRGWPGLIQYPSGLRLPDYVEQAISHLPLHRDAATRTSIENKARSTTQEGEADEVNPWLERAQWHQYLVGLERSELISCVEEPDKEEEPVEAAVWEAMDGRLWKQLLMFFARTQREHEWRSPKYRFTGRQREAWEELVDQPERRVDSEEMADEQGSHESEESE
ncbi:hypothetical protein LTR28_005091 [Elasticomyces elasticus]|nr:hypothetical protein LTR28_005091 [Elasticomyces elasticus]